MSQARFIDFLAQPDVFQQLMKNAKDHGKHDSNPLQALSRFFNDLPGNYQGFQPLLKTVEEAFDHNEFDQWLLFAVHMGICDLLEQKSDIRNDVAGLLNTKAAGTDKGIIEKAKLQCSPAQVNTHLISAYLQFLSHQAVAIIVAKMKQEPNVAELDQRKDTRCMLIINKFTRNIGDVDAQYIQAVKRAIEATARDTLFQSKGLQAEMKRFLRRNNKTSLGQSTLFSGAGKTAAGNNVTKEQASYR